MFHHFERLSCAAAIGALVLCLLSSPAGAQCVDDAPGLSETCLTSQLLSLSDTYGGTTLDGNFDGPGPGLGDDWFYAELPPMTSLTVTLVFDHTLGDLDVEVRPQCLATTHISSVSSPSFPNEIFTLDNPTLLTLQVPFRIYMVTQGGCNDWIMQFSDAPCLPNTLAEDNDSCATATSVTNGVINSFGGLTVENTDEDWFELTLPPFSVLITTLSSQAGFGNVNFALSTACGPAQVETSILALQEQEQIVNNSPVSVLAQIRVFMTTGSCAAYNLEWEVIPCSGLVDSFEPNDTCSTATQFNIPTNTTVLAPNLIVADEEDNGQLGSLGDDWYGFSVPANHQLKVDADFTSVLGKLEMTLYTGAAGCGTPISTGIGQTDLETIHYVNQTGVPQTVSLRVYIGSVSGCTGYELTFLITEATCLTIPDDVFEDNDICTAAIARDADSTTIGLRAFGFDQDFWIFDVPSGVTQTVDVQFLHAVADIFIFVNESDCSTGVGQVNTATDNETLSFTNTGPTTKSYVLGVAVNPLTPAACASYDLILSNDFEPFPSSCIGDGGNQAGCTNCPCTNNATPGATGGCLNSAGTSTTLAATGDPSASLLPGVSTDLRFTLSGAPANAFSVLLSGSAVAPQNMGNMCFGMSSGVQSPEHDGLRCAVMNQKRHGGRSANAAGDVMAPSGPSRVWGGEAQPNGGLWKQGGFVAGQTRFFQVTYRENVLLGCMRGLNTSQAVRVTFAP